MKQELSESEEYDEQTGFKESKILKAKIAAQKTKIDILNAENESMTT